MSGLIVGPSLKDIVHHGTSERRRGDIPIFASQVDRYVRLGTEGREPRVGRRIALINVISAYSSASMLAFALICGVLDYKSYLPLIAVTVPFGLIWAAVPFFHRFGIVVLGTFLWATVGISELSYAVIAGADLSTHYFLLAVPAITVMVLGAEHKGLALLYTLIYLALFISIEAFFPRRTDMVPVTDGLATISFMYSVSMSALMNFAMALYAFLRADRAEIALDLEHQRSERLLMNLMPASIAQRLKLQPREPIADHHPAVTILFADIVDFTPRAGRLAPTETVRFLNLVFSRFDQLAEQHGLEKIKTIGDAYMVAGGMPDQHERHAAAVADMALDILQTMQSLGAELGEEVSVRIGIHTGPALAGVIGTRKPFYDVWGDTVNMASRMEAHGTAGRIQLTRGTMEALGTAYTFEPRGKVHVKGKGEMELWYLTGRSASTEPNSPDQVTNHISPNRSGAQQLCSIDRRR